MSSARVISDPGWDSILRAARLNSVEGVYAGSAGEIVTSSGSTEVRRVVLPDPAGGAERVVYLKKYWVNRPAQLWSGFFRGTFLGRSKARREYENLVALRAWGLHAPEAVAYGEERRAGFVVRSFLMSAGIPDPMPLDTCVRDRLSGAAGPEARRRRRQLLDALADATRRLHERRFVHHDYFWRNIILRGDRLDEFWLIDAHKGRVWAAGGAQSGRASDLAALDAPAPRYFRRSERLRFFLRYCGKVRLDAESRRLLGATLRKAAPQRAKQLQRVAGRGNAR